MLLARVVDPDRYVFGPPGSASGSFSHKYGSGSGYGSGSFHHQAKIVRKTLILLFCDFFMTFFTSVPDLDLWDPYVFGPPGSVRQRYGSEDPDPHPDPYQNFTDLQHCFWLYEDEVPLLKCTWSAREGPSRQKRSIR